MIELRFASGLAAPAERVWRHATSPEGVNLELWPLLRMRFPPGVTDLTTAVRPGERLGRCWLLLGGVLPVEYDDLVFEAVEPGVRFLERSTLLTQRVWVHERILEPIPGGTRLVDRVRAEPRIGALASLHRASFRLVFRWRHRRLRALFGTPAPRAEA